MKVRFIPATLNMRKGSIRFLVPVLYRSTGFVIDAVIEADLRFDPKLGSLAFSKRSYLGALIITEDPLKTLLKEESFGIAFHEENLLQSTGTSLVPFSGRSPYMVVNGKGPGFEKDFPSRERNNVIEFLGDSIVMIFFPTKIERRQSIPVSIYVFSPVIPTTWKVLGQRIDDYREIIEIWSSILHYQLLEA